MKKELEVQELQGFKGEEPGARIQESTLKALEAAFDWKK